MFSIQEMISSQDTRVRVYLRIGLVYGVLCFTSFLSGMTHMYPHFLGYLYGVWAWFDHFSSNVSEPITHAVLRVLLYLSIPVFWIGIFCSALLMLVIICILFIPYLIVLMGLKIASISLVGGLIVFVVTGIGLAALLRKHWTAIVLALAWLIELFAGFWKLMQLPAEETNGHPANARTSEKGDMSMPRRSEPPPHVKDRVARKDNALAENVQFEIPEPETVFAAFRQEIRANATAKAYKSKAEMVNSVIELQRAEINAHDAQTDWLNKDMRRGEKTLQQEINVVKAEDTLDELLAKREEKAKLPRNPTDLFFETEIKPTITNAHLTKLHEAKSKAEAAIKVARAKFELKEEIDKGPGTPEEKEDLKKEIESLFAGCLDHKEQVKQTAASASPYADEHDD